MHASNEEEHVGTEQQHLPNGFPASKGFYQHLIQCAPNVILFLSLDHLILEFNPEAERLYGRKREDVLGKDYFEEFLPDDAREAVTADFEKVLTGRPTRDFENAVVTNDGQERVLRWNIDSVLDSEGKASGIVAVGQDITERKQSDSTLSESLRTSDDIVRTIPSGLFIYRYEAPDSLSLLYGNPEAERLTGIKVAEWLGKEFNEIWPNAKEQGVTEAFLGPMKTGQTYETEDLYYKDERLEGAFRIRAFQLPGHKLAVAFENITERKQTELALQESENRYRTVVENAGEGIVVTQDGILRFINPHFTDITGYSEKEFKSRPFIEFVHPDDREQVMEIHIKRLKGEEVPPVYEFRAVDKQGNTKWLENNGILIEWGGRPASLNFLRDITDRKEAEEALRESEERLKILFESAPDAYYIHDLEGKFVDGNRAAEELLGYQKEEAVGESFFELGMVTEADVPKSMAAIADNRDGKPAGPHELMLNHKDGSKVMVETRSYPVDIAGETLILGIARDITERKEAEQKIKSSEERLKVLFEYAPDAYYMTDLQGRFVDGNRAAEQTIGYKREELIGKSFLNLKLLSLKQIPRAAKLLAKNALGQPTGPDEFVLNRKDGTKVDVEIRTYPVQINGQALVLGIARDITERKKAEEALRAERDKLQALMDGITRAGIGIDIIGADYKVLFQNQTLEERFGKIHRESCYEHYMSLEEPCDQCPVTEAIQQNVAVEAEQRGHDGRDYQIFTAPVPEADGSVSKAIEIVLDITERKRAEEALRESEERFRSLSESSPVGVFRTDAQGAVLYTNPQWQRITGLRLEESLGFGWVKALHPGDKDRIIEEWDACLREEKGYSGEFRFLTPSGEVRWVYTSTSPIRSARGDVVGHVGMNQDITERKKAEDTLRESEEKLRLMSTHMYDYIMMLDLDFNMQFVNRAGKGLTIDQLTGKPPYIHADKSEQSRIKKELEKVVETGETSLYKTEYHRPDGSQIYFESIASPIFAENKLTGIVISSRDITLRTKTEKDLQDSEGRLNSFLESATDGFILFDSELNHVEMNKSALKITGLDRKDVIGKNLVDVVPDIKQTGRYDKYKQVMKTGTPYYISDLISHPLTSDKHIELKAFKVGVGLGIIFTDITERKRAEAERTRLIDILETTSDFVSTSTPDGELTYINRAGKRMLGWPEDESCDGREIPDAHPDWAFHVVENEGIPAAIEHGVWEGETALLRSDGTEIPVSQVIMAHKAPDDKVEYFSTIIRDITERKQAEEELRESEKRFRSLSEAAFEGIAITERGVLVDANQAFARIYHCSLEELKGSQVMELVAPEHREKVQENIRSGYEGVYEHKGLRKDGSLIDLEIHGSSIIYQGRTMRLTAIRDITEQKKARLALEAEKKFTENAINAQMDTFFLFEPETGKAIRWNKAFTDICGYTDEEIARMPAPASYYSPEDLERAGVFIQKVLKEGTGAIELELICKDGRKVPTEYRVSVINNDQGEPKYIISIGRDITERKLVEDKLRESKERLTKAFQASPNLMGIVDLDERRRLLGNEALVRVTGYSIEEVVGTTFDELNFWVEPDRVHETFQSIRQDGVLQDYETDIRTKHGEIRTLRYHGVLLDIPGKNVGMFSAEDITEQREAERRIKEYQSQLKSLASELSLAEERERRRIAAGIHDDIAQKLVMVKFGLQSLQASVTDTDVSGSLEKQCQLMDQVVAEARSLTFELSNPVLYQVGLEAAVESYLTERIQGQFGIKCNFKSEGSHSSLEEDIRVVLFQAVRELLANIVKHASASTVEVCISKTEDRLRIVVQDDGIGFDPTEIGPHLVGRGGFGLFNIRERLEYLGGNVKIESRRKKGARVTMTVAIRTDAAAE